MRQRRVRTDAFDFNAKFVARRHDRALGHAEMACRHARPIVNAENRINRKLREQAIVDHCLGAGAPFFCRLKDEHDRAVKLAVLGQMPRCAEQHRGMSIMAARVHLAVVLRAMIEAV